MTVLSSRHALAAAALMAVAAAPVWLHAAASPTRDDCRDAAAFFGAAEIGGVPVEPAPRWGQVAEGQKGVGGQGALRVRVLRSFEPSPYSAFAS